VVTLVAEVLFKQLLICTVYNGLNIAGNEMSDDKYVSEVHGGIVSMQYAWVHQ